MDHENIKGKIVKPVEFRYMEKENNDLIINKMNEKKEDTTEIDDTKNSIVFEECTQNMTEGVEDIITECENFECNDEKNMDMLQQQNTIFYLSQSLPQMLSSNGEDEIKEEQEQNIIVENQQQYLNDTVDESNTKSNLELNDNNIESGITENKNDFNLNYIHSIYVGIIVIAHNILNNIKKIYPQFSSIPSSDIHIILLSHILKWTNVIVNATTDCIQLYQQKLRGIFQPNAMKTSFLETFNVIEKKILKEKINDKNKDEIWIKNHLLELIKDIQTYVSLHYDAIINKLKYRYNKDINKQYNLLNNTVVDVKDKKINVELEKCPLNEEFYKNINYKTFLSAPQNSNENSFDQYQYVVHLMGYEKYYGSIIGKDGGIVKQLRKKHKVIITVPHRNSSKREIIIKGSHLRNVMSANREILQIIEECCYCF